MTQKEYMKLAGRGPRTRGFISHSSCTLWLGADHLLQVESQSGYSEDYKRFYLRDIQSIIIRKTQTAAIWNAILAVVAAVFGLIAWSVRETPAAVVVLGSFAAILLVCLVINAARGPISICHLKTAVQIDQLPSLRRLRNARKALAILEPLIEQAQGPLNAEDMKTHLEAAAQNPPPIHMSSSVFPGPARASRRTGTAAYAGRAHRIFFGLLLVSGLVDIVHIFYHPFGFLAFGMILTTGLAASAVIALVKQQGTNLDSATRTLTWISSIYVGLLIAVGYAAMMAMSIVDPSVAADQWTALKRFSEFEPFETPWLLVSLVVNIIVASGLGALGLLSSRKRRHEQIPASSPSVTPGPPTP